MRKLKWRQGAMTVVVMLTVVQVIEAADHGPVFGLATPTNPQGGWSFDLGVNGRSGVASNLEAELSYGLTQNIKLRIGTDRCADADRVYSEIAQVSVRHVLGGCMRLAVREVDIARDRSKSPCGV